MMSSGFSRRELLAGSVSLSAVALLTPRLITALPLEKRSRVVLVQAKNVDRSKSYRPERATIKRLLEQGLLKLFDQARDPRAALAKIARPVDLVGLKVNCLAGRQMSTHVEIIEELVNLLAAMGLPRNQVIVFDRSNLDLRQAGFEIREGGTNYLCVGNDRAGYDEDLTLMPSGASRLARTASSRVNVLINLPILKDHGLAGITGALKNNFGLIHNPNKFHLNGCDPHVAEVNALPLVRQKQKLIITDALRPQIDGGPAYSPAGAVAYGALLLATDPVAHDIVALDLVEQLRKKHGLPTLLTDKRPARHIIGAANAGLGIADRRRIDLIKVEV